MSTTQFTFTVLPETIISHDISCPETCPIATTLKKMGFNVLVGYKHVYFYPLGCKPSSTAAETEQLSAPILPLNPDCSQLSHISVLQAEQRSDNPQPVSITLALPPEVLTAKYYRKS